MTDEHAYFQFAMPKRLEVSQLKDTFIDFSKVMADEHSFFLVNDLSPYRPVPTKPVDFDTVIFEKLEQVREKKGTDVSFDFWLNNQITDGISFTLATSYRVMLLSINRNFFMANDTVLPVLNFCKSFDRFFNPEYGYGITEPNDLPQFSIVDAGKIETLYTYNFLRSRIVSTYKRKKLHSLPAWQMKIYQMVEYLSQWISIPLRTGNNVDPTTKKRLNYWVFLGFSREDKTSSDPKRIKH